MLSQMDRSMHEGNRFTCPSGAIDLHRSVGFPLNKFPLIWMQKYTPLLNIL